MLGIGKCHLPSSQVAQSLSLRTLTSIWPHPHSVTQWASAFRRPKKVLISRVQAFWKQVMHYHGKSWGWNIEKETRSDRTFCLQVSSYRVGLDISISFEFRTSKTSGVLLAVSNQASDGLGIEIVQGKVGAGENYSLIKMTDIGSHGNVSALSPSSSSSTLTTGPAGSQRSMHLKVTVSATIVGTQSRPANSATGWSWWWMANRVKPRVPTHGRPLVTPATRFTSAGILVRQQDTAVLDIQVEPDQLSLTGTKENIFPGLCINTHLQVTRHNDPNTIINHCQRTTMVRPASVNMPSLSWVTLKLVKIKFKQIS